MAMHYLMLSQTHFCFEAMDEATPGKQRRDSFTVCSACCLTTEMPRTFSTWSTNQSIVRQNDSSSTAHVNDRDACTFFSIMEKLYRMHRNSIQV
jgi:hypothetical protein